MLMLWKQKLFGLLKSICSGYSNRSCEQLNSTLKAMFPDSKITEAFSMGRTKSMYLINYWLAPLFKSLLLSKLNKSDIFVFSFDENLNQVTQCNVTELKVNVQFIFSTFLWPWNTPKFIKTFSWSYQGVGSFEMVSDING